MPSSLPLCSTPHLSDIMDVQACSVSSALIHHGIKVSERDSPQTTGQKGQRVGIFARICTFTLQKSRWRAKTLQRASIHDGRSRLHVFLLQYFKTHTIYWALPLCDAWWSLLAKRRHLQPECPTDCEIGMAGKGSMDKKKQKKTYSHLDFVFRHH